MFKISFLGLTFTVYTSNKVNGCQLHSTGIYYFNSVETNSIKAENTQYMYITGL